MDFRLMIRVVVKDSIILSNLNMSIIKIRHKRIRKLTFLIFEIITITGAIIDFVMPREANLIENHPNCLDCQGAKVSLVIRLYSNNTRQLQTHLRATHLHVIRLPCQRFIRATISAFSSVSQSAARYRSAM